jgi:uncharacterized protein YbjT (DUF2867 family)
MATMKIVIVGGTGLIGSRLVDTLQRPGVAILSASPSSGVDTVTGQGLAEALIGAQIVVDVSNAPSIEQDIACKFFQNSGRNLLSAEQEAGVQHHVALSIVGVSRLPESGYFRAKMLQENLIRGSEIPYTIVRSTPFFEYLDGIIAASAKGEALHISPAYIQPIAADDVIVALRDVVLGRPQRRELEVVGPDSFRLTEIARQLLAANQDPRTVVEDPHAPYFGAVLRDDSLLPGDHPRFTPTRFEDWLRSYVAEALAPAV